MSDYTTKSALRERYIVALEKSTNQTEFLRRNADNLFNLDLTVYTANYSFESAVYNAVSQSVIDSTISLHPEQQKALRAIYDNHGLIFSAPTSFGKTFVMFEFISRELPNNVFLVVPTLALVEEYNRKIIRKYSGVFGNYRVHTNLTGKLRLGPRNIFILTHDRVIDPEAYKQIDQLQIDLLVIDEVYKLQRSERNDRVLVLNLAYYNLVKRASRHILLAPFIGGIVNLDRLPRKPAFLRSDYSPVVNEVQTYEIPDSENETRFLKTAEILSLLPPDENRIVYFPTVSSLAQFCTFFGSGGGSVSPSRRIISFLKWVRREFHKDWYVVRAVENGILVHNGQIPVGIRSFMLSLFNTERSVYRTLLSTSTLLEGVNTSAKHIVITKASRTGEEPFDAFDFFNLVGRSGRLYEHYLGVAHYVRSPLDPIFVKDEAIRSIEFEVTEQSADFRIHTNNYLDIPEYISFIEVLGVSHEEFVSRVGARYRFDTVKSLYDSYKNREVPLLEELRTMVEVPTRGRGRLIGQLVGIFDGKEDRLHSFVVTKLLDLRRPSISSIIDSVSRDMNIRNVDFIINLTLRLKGSYIEHEFYSKLQIVHYFMEIDGHDQNLVDVIDSKVKRNIDLLYYTDSKTKKMLKDLGISDRDIEKIVSMIGESIEDLFDLKAALVEKVLGKTKLEFISQYVIESL